MQGAAATQRGAKEPDWRQATGHRAMTGVNRNSRLETGLVPISAGPTVVHQLRAVVCRHGDGARPPLAPFGRSAPPWRQLPSVLAPPYPGNDRRQDWQRNGTLCLLKPQPGRFGQGPANRPWLEPLETSCKLKCQDGLL